MARRKGGDLNGKAGGLVHYTNKYGDVTQRPGGGDAIAFATLPTMEINRKNASEFSMASHYSKLWRDSIAKYSDIFRLDLHSDLSRVFKLTMQSDKLHLTGKRSLDVRLNREHFKNYSLGRGDFNSLVSMPLELIVSEDRKQVQCLLPGFNPRDCMDFPDTTNCFRLFMTATVINKYEYDEKLKSYIPERVDEFVLTQIATTDKYYSYEVIPEQSINVEFDFIPDVEHIVIICMGIEFSILTSEKEKTNPAWCGMKVMKVA